MVNEFLFPRRNRLQILFYIMIACAIIGPTLSLRPISTSLTFFRIAFFLLAGGIVLRVLLDKSYLRLKSSLSTMSVYQVRWYALFFVFWYSYAILSLLWVKSEGFALRYLFLLGTMLLLALSFPLFVSTEKNLWRTFVVLFGVFAGVVYYGVFESITMIHLPPSRAFAKISGSVTSVFTNQNDLATCITLGLPFLITALFMLKLKGRVKWFVYITAVFTFYVLLTTASRSNTFFALPLASLVIMIAVPFVVERSKITKKNIWKAIALTLVGIIVATALSSIFLSPESREMAKEKLSSTFSFLLDVQKGGWLTSDDGTGVIEGSTGQSPTVRKFLILNGLNFLLKSKLMGVGAGNVEAWMKNAPHVGHEVNIHNWWVEVLVNFGVIVFVIYMALYFGLLRRLWRLASLKYSPHSSSIVRWGAYACFASLIGFFIGGMAPSSCVHFTPMWTVYGLSLAVIALGEFEKKKQARENTTA